MNKYVHCILWTFVISILNLHNGPQEVQIWVVDDSTLISQSTLRTGIQSTAICRDLAKLKAWNAKPQFTLAQCSVVKLSAFKGNSVAVVSTVQPLCFARSLQFAVPDCGMYIVNHHLYDSSWCSVAWISLKKYKPEYHNNNNSIMWHPSDDVTAVAGGC